MSDQQRSFIRRQSSQLRDSAKATANYVPGASLFVLVKDASGATHIKWLDTEDETSSSQPESPLASHHTPDEQTRLLVTGTIEDAPPFVACLSFCFALNVMLACFFIGILIVYLHYRFGFTTPPYTEQLCIFMQTWNQKLLWLFVATCALGVVDLVKLCLEMAEIQEGYDTTILEQRHPLQEASQAPWWTKGRSVLKYVIDVIFFVWMIQAFLATNYNVKGTQECPNMYTFTHIYSTIVSVLAVLGIVSACLLWCLVKMYGKGGQASSNHDPVQINV
jgi:hypothetical protein